MELVDGLSLAELLRGHGRLTVPLAVVIADDVLNALGAAHRAGLVHRDVSPGNVMVTHGGTVKVTDFGIARAFGPEAARRRGRSPALPRISRRNRRRAGR